MLFFAPVLAMVFLLAGCVNQNNGNNGQQSKIEPRTKVYYDSFRKKCEQEAKDLNCCLSSVDGAEQNNSLIYGNIKSTKLSEVTCPDGFIPNALQCIDSYISCSLANLSKIRPEVKTYIDELSDSEITSIKHTTKSIGQAKKRSPEYPKAFDAGRYEVVFNNGNDKKVMIFQTEEKVGHISPVTPGKTDIGGYVEIQKNPEKNNAEGITSTTDSLENQSSLNNYTDLKLNESELDYLIRILYKKFDKPSTDTQANNLNSVKDYALAIKFSGKNGINEYHNNLIKELK